MIGKSKQLVKALIFSLFFSFFYCSSVKESASRGVGFAFDQDGQIIEVVEQILIKKNINWVTPDGKKIFVAREREFYGIAPRGKSLKKLSFLDPNENYAFHSVEGTSFWLALRQRKTKFKNLEMPCRIGEFDEITVFTNKGEMSRRILTNNENALFDNDLMRIIWKEEEKVFSVNFNKKKSILTLMENADNFVFANDFVESLKRKSFNKDSGKFPYSEIYEDIRKVSYSNGYNIFLGKLKSKREHNTHLIVVKDDKIINVFDIRTLGLLPLPTSVKLRNGKLYLYKMYPEDFLYKTEIVVL